MGIISKFLATNFALTCRVSQGMVIVSNGGIHFRTSSSTQQRVSFAMEGTDEALSKVLISEGIQAGINHAVCIGEYCKHLEHINLPFCHVHL